MSEENSQQYFNHLLQPRYAEDHLCTHNMSNLKADVSQQEKISPAAPYVN